MKTIKDYLEELPEPQRSEALQNYDDQKPLMEEGDESAENLRQAVSRAFIWSQTPQGVGYWSKISKL